MGASIYFSDRQLEVLSNLCSNWSSSLEAVSKEFLAETAEYSEIVAEIGEKASAKVGLKEKKAQRRAIVEEALEIARRGGAGSLR